MANERRNPGSPDVADTSYYSGAALPTAGNVLFFLEGSDKLTTNMNALEGIDLLGIVFAPQCKTVIEGSPLKVTCDQAGTGYLKYEGSANGTLKFAGGTDNDIQKIMWWASSPSARGEFSAMDILGNLEVKVGSVYIATDALFGASSEVWVLSGFCHIAGHATDVVPTINCKKGSRTRIERAFTTLNVDAGAEVEIDIDTYTGATVNNKGGKVIWISGTITNLNHEQGVLDLSRFRRYGQSAVNYKSTSEASVIKSTGGAQPTLGSSTTTPIGSDSGAVIMYAGSGGGTSFGVS